MEPSHSLRPPFHLKGGRLDEKRNFMAILEYDGSAYHGWQWQKKKISLQQVFQEALQKIAGIKINVVASGRTDAGVHALAQVVSFRLDTRHSPQTLERALNAHLPDSLVVKKVLIAKENFHAQLNAKKKLYAYFILNDSLPSAFLNRVSWEIHRPLDWKAMKKALKYLKGRHDFKSFQSVGTPVKTSVRTLHKMSLQRVGKGLAGFPKSHPLHFLVHPNLYVILLEANGFLKQMVRNIVGTVVQVGLGKMKPESIQEILKAKDRRKAGIAAPAKGLFLVEVKY